MRRARPVLLAFALVAVAGPALAVTPKPKPPQLDLELRHDDIVLTPQPRPRRYAARIKDDPWRALDGGSRPLAGPGIPQFPDEEGGSESGGELPLLRLLDGRTIPILRIRMAPGP